MARPFSEKTKESIMDFTQHRCSICYTNAPRKTQHCGHIFDSAEDSGEMLVELCLRLRILPERYTPFHRDEDYNGMYLCGHCHAQVDYNFIMLSPPLEVLEEILDALSRSESWETIMESIWAESLVQYRDLYSIVPLREWPSRITLQHQGIIASLTTSGDHPKNARIFDPLLPGATKGELPSLRFDVEPEYNGNPCTYYWRFSHFSFPVLLARAICRVMAYTARDPHVSALQEIRIHLEWAAALRSADRFGRVSKLPRLPGDNLLPKPKQEELEETIESSPPDSDSDEDQVHDTTAVPFPKSSSLPPDTNVPDTQAASDVSAEPTSRRALGGVQSHCPPDELPTIPTKIPIPKSMVGSTGGKSYRRRVSGSARRRSSSQFDEAPYRPSKVPLMTSEVRQSPRTSRRSSNESAVTNEEKSIPSKKGVPSSVFAPGVKSGLSELSPLSVEPGPIQPEHQAVAASDSVVGDTESALHSSSLSLNTTSKEGQPSGSLKPYILPAQVFVPAERDVVEPHLIEVLA